MRFLAKIWATEGAVALFIYLFFIFFSARGGGRGFPGGLPGANWGIFGGGG